MMTPEVALPARPRGLFKWALDTLGGRLTLAFVLVVFLSMLAIVGVWRFYRATTFERASAGLLVGQIRAVQVVAAQIGDDPQRLRQALAASGLQVQVDGPMPVGAHVHPRVVGRIEARASAELGQPVRLALHYLPPRKAWACFRWKQHDLALAFPLDEWEGNLPTPVVLWLVLILLLTPACSALAVYWLQRPLRRLADAIAAQRARPVPLAVPPQATEEVLALVTAYNRVVAEIDLRDREREHILGGVSHDLKAPLARLRMRAASTDDSALADGIVRDVHALDRIAEQFLTFVRSGTEHAASIAPCSPVAVAQNVIARTTTADSPIGFSGSAPPVRCDALSLERILANLIDNARDYGQPPIRVVLSAGPQWARVLVQDQGVGIAPADLARASEPFVRLDAARGSAGHCGLGLAIVARLAAQAGGRVLAAPLAGGGFEIGVELPLAAPGDA